MKKSNFPLLYSLLNFLNRIAVPLAIIWFGSAAAGFAYLVTIGGFLLAAPAAGLFLTATYWIWKFWKKSWETVELWNYANMDKWIVVVSESPNDTTVYKRKRHHEIMLEKSQNPFGMRVLDLPFDPNVETWDEYATPETGRRDRETRDFYQKWKTFMLSDLNRKQSNEQDRQLYYYQIHLNQEV